MRLTIEVPAVGRMRMSAMTMVAGLILLGGAAAAMAAPLDAGQQPIVPAQVYKVGGDVKPPVLTYSVDAAYPKNHKEKASRVVVCSMTVNTDGLPTDVAIKRSAGKDFDANAMEAVRQFRFKPATRKGQPVAVAIVIEVNFHRY